MNVDIALQLLKETIIEAFMLGGPILLLALVAGVAISIMQTVTSVQEMTLTFVPKILAMFIALLIAFPWMMDRMINYTRELFMNIPNYLR